MQKSDLKEIRKYLKKTAKDGALASGVHAFYVVPGEGVVWEKSGRFSGFGDDERAWHAAVLGKVVASSLGKTAIPAETDPNEALLAFRKDIDAGKTETVKELKERLLENYVTENPYYAFFVHFTYHPPGRTSDGGTWDDSEALYDALVFAVCPAKLQTAALGLDGKDVKKLPQKWAVGAPALGFLYPSFDDREESHHEAVLYMKKPDAVPFLSSVFRMKEDAKQEAEQKELWTDIMTGIGISPEEMSAMNETLLRKAEEEDNPYLGMRELRVVAEEAGIKGEDFDRVYASAAGGAELSASAIADRKVTVKTGSAKVTVPAEHAAFVRIKKVDGVECLVIPVDGVVTMNGAEVGKV